ncbi:Tad domain-containing protein [Roseibium salinum]|nr:Tad domain-containing protein [Roseibium salinum]
MKNGYALTLALIAMPLIMGFAVLVLDASRIHNLHTDLQNAVDAMAIAGARELDGRGDAITRATAAVEELSQNEAWFGQGGTGLSFGSKINVVYDASDADASTVDLIFLTDIPASDDTPIDDAFVATNEAATPDEAQYALVRAKPQSLTTMFPLPIGGRDTINVSTEAVAVYTFAACEVTPIYICNPFEETATPDDEPTFNDHFNDGDTYGKEILFQNSGASSTLPGNFGFLRTYGSGANVLANALATGNPGVCYGRKGVDTEPGATVGPVEHGINTRLGLYNANFKNNVAAHKPDKNARFGQKITGNAAQDCKDYDPEEDPGMAMGLPRGEGGEPLSSGGQVSAALTATQFDEYWHVTHDGLTESPYEEVDGAWVLKDPDALPDHSDVRLDIRNSVHHNPNPVGDFVPSRYDIYLHELAQSTHVHASANEETGNKRMCHTSGEAVADRRQIFSAVINCQEHESELKGAATDIPVEAYTLMFLTRPAVSDGSNREFSLEIVDVTGKGGFGLIDDSFREESVLVR